MMEDGFFFFFFLYQFSADQMIANELGKKCFGASCSMDKKLLLVARHTLTMGLQKAFNVGTVNFADSLSPPSVVKKVCFGS